MKLLSTIVTVCLTLTASASDIGGDTFFNQIKVVFTAESPVLSSEVTSQVTNITRRFGESFKKGELLISLDDSFYRANHLAAQAVVHASKIKYDATSSLYKDENVSQVEFEEAAGQYTVAQKNAVEARNKYEGCRIVAPFDGRVVEVMIHEHEMAKESQPMIKIVNDATLYAQFLLPEKMFRHIKREIKVSLYVAALDTHVEGEIRYIAAEIDPASRTFEVKVLVENKSGELRSGMNGILELEALKRAAGLTEK